MAEMNHQDFFTKIDRVSGFAVVNLLWVVSILFVVTIPLATVGLFAVFSDWVRGKDSEALTRFGGAIRQHWIKACLIGLIDGVVLGVIAFNLHILPQMDLPISIYYPFLGVMLFIGLLVVMVNLYIWSLLVMYDLDLKRLINIAIKLSVGHLGWTVQLLVLTGGVLMMGLFLPALISVLVLFSGCAYLMTWGAWRIIQQYDADLCQISAQMKVVS
jgi:uncharacterized membrane protein YesL